MKLKHAKIIVQPMDELKKEWVKGISGRKKSIQSSNEIIFTSLDTVAKVFSKTRMEILGVVISQKPKSIYELAKLVGRDFKNVHMDVKLLAEIGLIELKDARDPRSGLIPLPKFSGIDLDFAA